MNQHRVIEEPHNSAENSQELDRIWRHHQSEFRRRARVLAQGNIALAEAFLSRTILKIVEYLHRNNHPIQNFIAFFHVSLRNTANDHWRSFRRDTEGKRQLTHHLARNGETDRTLQTVMARQELDHLHRALRQMPSDIAALIHMRVFEQLPYREIALRQGISEALARKRMQTARQMLRTRLEAGKFPADDHKALDQASIPTNLDFISGGPHVQ